MPVSIRNAARTYLVLLSSLILLVAILASSGALYVSSQASLNSYWETLGGDPYRRSLIPLSMMNGTIGGNRKWSFDPAAYSALSYYPVDTNPLIINIDGTGSSEILVVNSGGVLILLSGLDGSLLSYKVVNGEPHSTPAAADLDNDGWLEVVLGTKNGSVVAIDFGQNWAIEYLWRTGKLDERISTSPLVVDLDSDGAYEVVVQTRSGIVCLDGASGNLLWSSKVNDMVMVQSPALAGDIDGDTVLDVIGTGFTGKVYAVSGKDGSIIWQKDLWSADQRLDRLFLIHTPVVADVDGDGSEEVVLSLGREVFGWSGGVVTRTGFLGAIAILDAGNGQIEAILNPSDPPLYSWFAQPALAAGDVDGDGAYEILVADAAGNIDMIDFTGTGYTVSRLFTYDTYWTNPANGPMSPNSASIVIANVDGDSSYEAVVLSTGESGGRLSYLVYIYDFGTGTYTMIYDVYADLGVGVRRFNWPSISLGDVDNDQSLEVVLAAYRLVICLE